MPTALDTKLVPKVKTLISTFGRDAVFSVPADRVYDPDDGYVDAPPAASHTVKVTPLEAYEERYADGNLIRVGDAKTLVAASGLAFTPAKGLTVSIDGVTWTIVAVAPIATGEQTAAYEMHLRR